MVSVDGTPGNLVGRIVNGHQVIRRLGEGGMGEVYVAQHLRLGTLRVVKTIHDDARTNPSIARRFTREALALGRLNHPHIVAVIDHGHLDDVSPFLICEYVEGGDLHDVLTSCGPLGLTATLEVLSQVAHALEYAHGQGVIHRDLKPANLLLSARDHRRLKIIDFGLARLMSAPLLTRLTLDQQIMGSPQFMSPEQAMAEPDVGAAADVYALAGIAYAALSGQPVFGERPALAHVFAHACEAPPRLSERVMVPARLDELFLACLDKRPDARPTAAQVAHEVRALLLDLGGARAGWIEPAPVLPPPQLAYPVKLSPSMLREKDVIQAADYVFAPITGERRHAREAMQRQMLAIISELADELAPTDPNVAARRDALAAIERRLAELELESAVLEAEFEAADGNSTRAVEREDRRAHLAAWTGSLRLRLEAEQRELAVIVDRHRAHPSPITCRAYGELDELVARARSLGARPR